MQIASNFEEFVKKVFEAEIKALNNPAGRELTHKLFEMMLAGNPDMTPDEWEQIKNRFLDFIFLAAVSETPELMQELSNHVWNELKNNRHKYI